MLLLSTVYSLYGISRVRSHCPLLSLFTSLYSLCHSACSRLMFTYFQSLSISQRNSGLYQPTFLPLTIAGWISFRQVVSVTMMEIIEKCMRSSDLSGLHALQSMWDCSDSSTFIPDRLLKSNKTLLMTASRLGHLECCKFLLSIKMPKIDSRSEQGLFVTCSSMKKWFTTSQHFSSCSSSILPQKQSRFHSPSLRRLSWTWGCGFSFAGS